MISPRPAASAFTERTPRVVVARRLQRRRDRAQTHRFLAEGPQAVTEALAADAVVELFATAEACHRRPELTERAGDRLSPITDRGLAALAETDHPQGLVAVCSTVDVPLAGVLRPTPRLVAVLGAVRDPGNAGTVLRCADAAGAAAVVFAGDSVDPYNGKCVRATAGSLFHLPVVRGVEPVEAVRHLQAAGVRVLAAAGSGPADLDELADCGALAEPTAWLFGNEAHGLPAALTAAADAVVRIPIHGRAESLNLATAAAVCLYASARAQRRAV